MKRRTQHSEETRPPQGAKQDIPDPNKIGASTPFDFAGRNLTPYGGWLPVATMLERLGFQKLLEDILTVHRIPRAMTIYQFLLGTGRKKRDEDGIQRSPSSDSPPAGTTQWT